MRNLRPFLIFSSGAISALFVYQFFGNSLLYSSSEKLSTEPTKQVFDTKKDSTGNALKVITSDLISIKDDISSLRYELQNLKSEESSSNIDNNFLSEFALLKEEIKFLHKRLDKKLKRDDSNQVSSYLPFASQNKTSDDSNAPSSPLDFSATIGVAETARQHNLIKLDDQFQAEVTDEQWSVDVKQKITAFFDNAEAVQSSIATMECHSTMCQVEVRHENKEAEEKFNLEFPMLLGGSFSSTTYGNQIQNADGSSSAVLYLGN